MVLRRRVLALAALVCVACSSSDAAPAGAGPTLVKIESGEVRGAEVEGARAFMGIPFAAAPVGPLRWKVPQPPAPWTSPRDAKAFGPPCRGVDLVTGNVRPDGSEDCLSVNVWAPAKAPAKPAPVMVWIHGGGFVAGTAGAPEYDGSKLAAATGAIVVSMNYRLGTLGFLFHPRLSTDGDGNLGLLDQRAALIWVQRNIAAFGGDPRNVTIFGQSAGGISVCIHLATKKSRGLFHRAIIESGACDGARFLDFPTLASAEQLALDVATKVGCPDPAAMDACMRAKDAGALMGAIKLRKAIIGAEGTVIVPIIGGAEIPAVPRLLFERGEVAKVPVIIGSNKDEGTAFLALYKDPVDAATYAKLLESYGGAAFADKVQAEYPAGADPKRALSDFVGDALTCAARRGARALRGAGVPVYRYQLTYAISIPGYPGLGATHGAELPFVFGTTVLGAQASSEPELELLGRVQGYWGRFGQTGDPNGAGAPAWPAFDAAEKHLALDTNVTTGEGLQKQKCDFWDSL